jgi:hypothetical protein
VFAIADFASTPAELIQRDVAPGGHLGLFMGIRLLQPRVSGAITYTQPITGGTGRYARAPGR